LPEGAGVHLTNGLEVTWMFFSNFDQINVGSCPPNFVYLAGLAY
jgi:hypothetical protein